MSESDKPPSSNGDPAAPGYEATEPSIVRTIGNWFKRGLGRNGETTWRESVEELLEEEEEVAEQIRPEERDLLKNLLRFCNQRVEDAMLPRSDIVAVEQGASLQEVVALIKAHGHSRMPVYRETLDDVVGMVHMRDVMASWGSDRPFSLRDVMRRMLFVPPSMPVIDLLAEMRRSRLHMAVIVDEYGGTDGLATIEDLIEEIVGEIEDEHDVPETLELEVFSDGSIEADARTPIGDLEERLGMSLLEGEDEEDIDTVGGLVSALAGRVPRRRDRVAHPSGVEFEILDADLRRIKRVRVRRTARDVRSETA